MYLISNCSPVNLFLKVCLQLFCVTAFLTKAKSILKRYSSCAISLSGILPRCNKRTIKIHSDYLLIRKKIYIQASKIWKWSAIFFNRSVQPFVLSLRTPCIDLNVGVTKYRIIFFQQNSHQDLELGALAWLFHTSSDLQA